MIDELDQLRQLRPDVSTPSAQERERALTTLRRTIGDAGAAPVLAPAPVRRPRWRLPSLGVAMALLASVGALVIAGGALVLLGHHAHRLSAAATGPAAARGEILAANGSVLARPARGGRRRPYRAADLSPVLGAAGRSGLQDEYNPELRAGETLRTTLNAELQRVGIGALRTAIRRNDGSGGAFVAIDPSDGAVEAMGSLSKDPSVNQAIQDPGPTGSPFKPITAT